MDIVLTSMEKIDFYSGLRVVEKVEKLDTNTLNNRPTDRVLAAPINDEILVDLEGHNFYYPYEHLPGAHQNLDGLNVYFELECYPFFQKWKETHQEDKKGVLRLRRKLNADQDESVIAGDLFVLQSLLREPENVLIHHSNPKLTLRHTIITVNFGDGTMAHLEYTFDDKEEIELEWREKKQIIEFDRREMSPFFPSHYTNLPLTYTVDAVLDHSHQMTAETASRLKKWEEFVSGGWSR